MKRNGISPASFLGLLLMAAALFLCLHNRHEDCAAGESAAMAAAVLETWQPEATEPELPREMPVAVLDGRSYVGILEIPALEIRLAVLNDSTPEGLKTAPGRYYGSVYTDDLVICAHNYAAHFGKIGTLAPGETLIFTDTEGTGYSYRVEKVEILQPDAVGEMTQSPWDLTLFTCTPGGRERVTVRCMNMRINKPPQERTDYE